MITHTDKESARNTASWPNGRLRCRWLLVALFTAVFLAIALSNDVEAASRNKRRNSRNRQAAAAAKARKEQMIKSIQRQVASARRILAVAESQGEMSQVQASQALSELSSFRDEIENARDDEIQAAKTLREIEMEILAEQKPDSDLAIAQNSLKQAEEAVHQAIHRVLGLPAIPQPNDAGRLGDLAKISKEQRQKLEQDASFQSAQQNLNDAVQLVAKLRRTLFQDDADWVAAQRDLSDAHQRSREGTRQARTASLGALEDQHELQSVQRIAAEARTVIAQGEARLRQLGIKPPTKPKSSR